MKKKDENDLGFGTKTFDVYTRLLNKDGSVNVRRKGLSFFDNNDIYHTLMTISWSRFIFYVLACYFLVNLLFAGIYFILPNGSFGNLENVSSLDLFLELFYFSAQSLTTVGYGYLYPKGHLASSVAAIESMIGLMGFALATGLLYGRFSRPIASICYSSNILMSPYRDIKGLMFRIANKKQNELIELEARVTLTFKNSETQKREFHFLQLERDKVNFLALSWTIVHPIDESSPLFQFDHQKMIDTDSEIIILIKAVNETTSQIVYSRSSYRMKDLIWGAKFKPMTGVAKENGQMLIDVRDINEFEPSQLNK